MSKRYTIHEIKTLNEQSGGLFFSRNNMKFAGDTLRNLGVLHRDGKVIVHRKWARKPHMPLSQWEFIPETGRLRGI
jgi:hypothetical protein